MHFHSHDIFDNEINIHQFQFCIKRKTETKLYRNVCEDTTADNVIEYSSTTPYSIQFILMNQNICQTTDCITIDRYCNTGQKTVNVCEHEYNCKTTHEESGDCNNHSEETIAFAA